jgi:hypothetical protein
MPSELELNMESGVVCLEGEREQTAEIAYKIACEDIQEGHTVYWIDGGSLLDPSRMISPISNTKISQGYLNNLYACRAFTAHQMAEIFKRIEEANEKTKKLEEDSLMIITELHAMFSDSQLSTVEGTMLLTNTLHRIKTISKDRGLTVLITANKNNNRPTPRNIKQIMRDSADEYVLLR